MITDSRTLLVIGGNSDIAKHTVPFFIRDGYSVTLACKNAQSAQNAVRDIICLTGIRVKTLELDLMNEDSVNDFLMTAALPDVLLIASGVLPLNEDGTCRNEYDSADLLARINYLSLIKILLKLKWRYKERGHGSIIVLSSVAAIRGRMSNYLYGSTKAALSAFVSGYRAEMRHSGIYVLTVNLGLVDTRLIEGRKVNRLLASSKEKVAKLIYRGFKLKRNVIYAPSWWYMVMLMARALPECIFMRLKS